MLPSLADALQRVGQVAEFSDIQVTDANTQGLFQTRPLHVAAIWGDCEAIEVLIQGGAIVDVRGEHGFTALMEATAQNHVAACKLLVALGASPLPNDEGHLPSRYAMVSGNQELAQWLQARGF